MISFKVISIGALIGMLWSLMSTIGQTPSQEPFSAVNAMTCLVLMVGVWVLGFLSGMDDE